MRSMVEGKSHERAACGLPLHRASAVPLPIFDGEERRMNATCSHLLTDLLDHLLPTC